MTYAKTFDAPIRNAPVTRMMSDDYLRLNAERAAGGKGPLTVGSFLTYTLRGEAVRWGGAYAQRILRDLAGRADVQSVPSCRNGAAWISTRKESC